jgi:beta-xylosidase
VACLVAVATLGWSAATDLQAHARDRSEHHLLDDARHTLASTRFALAATAYQRALDTNQRDTLQTSIASTLGELGSTRSSLTGTSVLAFLQGLDVGTLQACLGGVQHSLQDIAAQQNGQAAQDITDVSVPCLTLDGGSSAGLVYPFDFPDPFVLLVGDRYYGYATNSVGGNIQIIESLDRVHWAAVGTALPKLPAWAAPDATWAPAVARIGNSYDLYYAAVVAAGGEECVSVATSAGPQGPFVDSSTGPLECQPTLGGSIDPSPFVGADGSVELAWKSNGGAGPATLWSQPLDPSGTAVLPGSAPTALLTPTQAWEGGVVEAPDLVSAGGRTFLVYSGNDWNTASYAIGVADCAGPAGPCTKPLDGPLLASGPAFSGPGGGSVFTDSSGGTWLAFHAWIPGSVGYPHSRDLYIRRIDFTGAIPVVGGPS